MEIPSPLSKYRLASFKELISLSTPIALTAFSSNLMMLCNRLFLAKCSLQCLEDCVQASLLINLIQTCLIQCTMMAQTFVGQCLGSNTWSSIGRYIWQMIWFSFFTLSFSIPFSLGFIPSFIGRFIHDPGANVYFRCLMAFNIFFPLTTALASFYLGLGKMRFVLFCTLIAHTLNLLLAPILVFGISGYIPSLGILGAGLATGISQIILFLLLFSNFLKKKYQEKYGTGDYRLHLKTLKVSLQAGLPNLLGKGIIMIAWSLTAYLLIEKKEDFLLIFSISNTLISFIDFFHDGLLKSLITIGSYIRGTQEKHLISRLIRSSFLFVFLSSALFFIPCVLCPNFILKLFSIKDLTSQQHLLLINACFWTWLQFFIFGIHLTFSSLLLSAADTLFTMFYDFFSMSLFFSFPMYLIATNSSLSPEAFFWVVCGEATLSAIVYALRHHSLAWKPRLA